VGGVGIESMENAISLHHLKLKKIGDDIMIEGYI
jgi:hypothetical protein